MSNSNENQPFTKKQYLNLANKAVNALWLSQLSKNSRNHLTYRNILNLKNAIKSERSRSNFRENFPGKNKFIEYNGNVNIGPPLRIGWDIYKTHPNGTKSRYITGAYNNGLPINLNKINVGFQERSGSPRALAALTIQRRWLNKKNTGPFSNPVIRSLVPKIMTPLPKRNKQSFVGSFRRPTSLNKEMTERSKGVNKFWRALLNDIKRQSVQRGSTSMLTAKEFTQLYQSNKIVYNLAHHKMMIPVAMRNSAWRKILEMRKK